MLTSTYIIITKSYLAGSANISELTTIEASSDYTLRTNCEYILTNLIAVARIV